MDELVRKGDWERKGEIEELTELADLINQS